MTTSVILKRAVVYCYVNKLRAIGKPKTAMDYLVKSGYEYHLRKAWKALKEAQNG
jgi:hypothetical protein